MLDGASWDLNFLDNVSTGKWMKSEGEALLSKIARDFRSVPWFRTVANRIRARAGQDTEGLALEPKACVFDARIGCAKNVTDDFAIRYAELLASLACDPESASSIAIARQWVHKYLLHLQPDTYAFPAFRGVGRAVGLFRASLAKRLTDPKCAGRGGIPADELKLIEMWQFAQDLFAP